MEHGRKWPRVTGRGAVAHQASLFAQRTSGEPASVLDVETGREALRCGIPMRGIVRSQWHSSGIARRLGYAEGRGRDGAVEVGDAVFEECGGHGQRPVGQCRRPPRRLPVTILCTTNRAASSRRGFWMCAACQEGPVRWWRRPLGQSRSLGRRPCRTVHINAHPMSSTKAEPEIRWTRVPLSART